MDVVFRMALTACVLGTVAGIVGTGRVTLSLVASGALMWSFVPLLQLLTGLLFTRGATNRAGALKAYFATGAYWHLWMITVGIVLLVWPEGQYLYGLLLSMALPFVFTARALRRLGSRSAVLLHQAATIVLLVTYIAWAIGGWARLAQEVGL